MAAYAPLTTSRFMTTIVGWLSWSAPMVERIQSQSPERPPRRFVAMTNAFLRNAVTTWAESLGGEARLPMGHPPSVRLPFLSGELRVFLHACRDVDRALQEYVDAVSESRTPSEHHRAVAMPASPGRLSAALKISDVRRKKYRLWWLFIDGLGGVVAIPPPGFDLEVASKDRMPAPTSRSISRSRPPGVT